MSQIIITLTVKVLAVVIPVRNCMMSITDICLMVVSDMLRELVVRFTVLVISARP